MKNYFIPMNDDYRKKNYPNGFLDGAAKAMKSVGNVLIVLAVVLLVLFVPLVILGIKVAVQGMLSGYRLDVTTGLSFAGVGIVFVIPAILCFRYGKKCKKKSSEKLLSDWAKKNNYTENIIKDYVNQVLDNDTYIMNIAGEFNAKNNVGRGFLTRDFLALNGVIMKQEDVHSIYLVIPESTITGLTIAVLAKNHSAVSPAKKEAVEELIAMLTSRNLNIETKQGKILTQKEFREIFQAQSDALQ